MQKDRNYYRLCEAKQLILEAKESDNELAIVLGERLQDALHDIETADRDEIADLCNEIDDLKQELSEARAEISSLEAELENVK